MSLNYRFMRLMFKLNMRINIKFFFTVFDMFRIEILMSAFANFRFLKANSTFGLISLVCSILVVGMTLFIIGISAWKMRQIKALKHEIFNTEQKTQTHDIRGKIFSIGVIGVELEQKIKNIPQLTNWKFLIEDMHPELMGIWMYFFTYTAVKELITVFCVMTFIGSPIM